MSHDDLVARAVQWLRNTKHCRAVLSDRHTRGRVGECPDAIGWKASCSYMVEVKVSLTDFRADKLKTHRRAEDICGSMGRLRWFMIPAEATWTDRVIAELPKCWGLLLAKPEKGVVERVKAVARDARSVDVLSEVALLVSWLHAYQCTKGPIARLSKPLTRAERLSKIREREADIIEAQMLMRHLGQAGERR